MKTKKKIRKFIAIKKQVAKEQKFNFGVLIGEIVGDDIIPVVEILKNKQNVSEFKLAEKLKLTINEVRNKIYRLQEHNLIVSTRKKDKEKGWYIYYWTLNTKEIKRLIVSLANKKLSDLKKQLEREQETNFLECSNKCMRLKFEDALDYEFRCPECGGLMIEEKKNIRLENIKKQIKLLEEQIVAV